MKKTKKHSLLIIALIISSLGIAQENTKLSTMDFVQVQNNNNAEAKFYYQNNWQILRERAVREGYIDSYQLLETEPTEDAPFHFVLITTYKDTKQFEKREENFSELIKEKGELRLLNAKQPGDFRKTMFNKNAAKHLE